VKPHTEETKKTSKEAMDRWIKAGFREIRDMKLGRKSTKSGRVEGGQWRKKLWSCDASDRDVMFNLRNSAVL
jgi:hypothetical protein